MLVACNNACNVNNFIWEVAGDSGAIDIPGFLANELVNRPNSNFWAVGEIQPAPKVKVEAQPKVELKEDESSGDDIADALDVSNVGTRPKARARKTTKE